MDQGAEFGVEYTIKDANGDVIDLSSFSGESQMRENYPSNTSYDFTVNLFSNGILSISMNSATTANIEAGKYVYDVEITSSSNEVFRVVEGQVTVTPNVTR